MSDAQTTVAELRQLVAAFVAEREWQRFHDPKNLAMAISIEAAELMEHFQWQRSDDLPGHLASAEIRSAVADELADVTCFALAFANAIDLDLSAAIRAKMKKNAAKYPPETFRGNYFKPA